MLSNATLQTIIWTSEVETSTAFYRDVLGLPVKGRSEGAVVFDVSGADLRVSPVPTTRPSEHTVAGFAVDDLDATLASLSARGVVTERFDHVRQAPDDTLTTPGGARVAWFRDPDGNLLSVVRFPDA